MMRSIKAQQSELSKVLAPRARQTLRGHLASFVFLPRDVLRSISLEGPAIALPPNNTLITSAVKQYGPFETYRGHYDDHEKGTLRSELRRAAGKSPPRFWYMRIPVEHTSWGRCVCVCVCVPKKKRKVALLPGIFSPRSDARSHTHTPRQKRIAGLSV